MIKILNNPKYYNYSNIVIEVFDDGGDMLDMKIIEKYTDFDFRNKIMDGTNPYDNFDNTDIIPKKEGLYVFDVMCTGGEDFNGETTEYWVKSLLTNCRIYNI